jgi:hypothetical protein
MATYLTYLQVVPIYVEYKGDSAEFQTPSQLISKSLGLFTSIPISECLKLLGKMNKYLLFIADEVDQIYTSEADSTIRLKILMELSELGTQTSGRSYTLCCGSSSHMANLISKNAVHDAKVSREFPLVGSAPNLNRKKFQQLRLYRQNARQDFDILKVVYDLTDQEAHLVYLLSGSNLRTVDDVVRALKADEPTLSSLVELAAPPSLWDQRVANEFDTRKDLFESLNVELVEKNYDLLNMVCDNSKCVIDVKWIDVLQPISYEDIQKVLKRHRGKYTLSDINSMVDKGYFSGPPDLMYLHASKPTELLFQFESVAEGRLNMRNILKFMKNRLSNTEITREVQVELVRTAIGVAFKYFCSQRGIEVEV